MVIYEYPLRAGKIAHGSGCVLAIGFFDGVHIAHRDLLRHAKDLAEERNLPFGVFTFRTDGRIKAGAPRIYTDEQKAGIFAGLGVDFTIFADFDAISGASPEEFVKEILVSDLNCRACVAGFNFRFGKNAGGSADDLIRLMQESHGEAFIKKEIIYEDRTVSASRIRELLADGKIKDANILLGAPYSIRGVVSHGESLGRRLGYPTVNLDIHDGFSTPKSGVYRCAAVIGESIYPALTNVGICPTFGGRKLHSETHILNFSGDLYGETIDVFFLDFMREEKAFSTQEQLIMQINVDKNKAISENGDITWQELGLR